MNSILFFPLIRNISNKTEDYLIFALVCLLYIVACAETDIFVPAFPQMIEYFRISDSQIQLVLSMNLIPLCIASVGVGPLSDSLGRRSLLLVCIGIFLVSSLGALLSEDFSHFLFWRVLQGLSTAGPMVIGTTLIFDRFSMSEAGSYVGILNSVITAAMAGAPILGAVLTQNYGWRLGFLTIFLLSLVSFGIALFFLKDTLPIESRRPLNLKQTGLDYLRLCRSPRYLAHSFLCLMPIVCILLYVGNLSVVVIKYFGYSLSQLSYFQASTMGSYIVFSYLSTRSIAKFGLEKTIQIGSVVSAVGATLFLGACIFDGRNVPLICVAMALVAAGGSFLVGPHGAKSMEVFPNLKGTAASLFNALRQFSAASMITLGEYFFDGTLMPVAGIVFGCAALGAALKVVLSFREE